MDGRSPAQPQCYDLDYEASRRRCRCQPAAPTQGCPAARHRPAACRQRCLSGWPPLLSSPLPSSPPSAACLQVPLSQELPAYAAHTTAADIAIQDLDASLGTTLARLAEHRQAGVGRRWRGAGAGVGMGVGVGVGVGDRRRLALAWPALARLAPPGPTRPRRLCPCHRRCAGAAATSISRSHKTLTASSRCGGAAVQRCGGARAERSVPWRSWMCCCCFTLAPPPPRPLPGPLQAMVAAQARELRVASTREGEVLEVMSRGDAWRERWAEEAVMQHLARRGGG